MEKIAFSGFNSAAPNHHDFINALLISGDCVFELGDIRDAQMESMDDTTKKIIESNNFKIDVCDTYFVFNYNLFLSKSAEREVEYAKSKGKKVLYLYDVDELLNDEKTISVINNDDLIAALVLTNNGKFIWNNSVFGKSICANALNIVRYCVEVQHLRIYDELIDISPSDEMREYLESRKNNYDTNPADNTEESSISMDEKDGVSE